MATQNGSTISSVTVASNNMTIIWINNTPNEYTFQNHYIYLLSSRSQFSGTSLPTSGAPGTLVPYEVPTTVQYLNPPAKLNGYNVGFYYTDSSTSYTIGGLPPGTYNVLLVTNYTGTKPAPGYTTINPTFIGAFWPNPVTVPKINTAVSIPDLISVVTNETFVKFTQKAALYNGTYPATSYTYYAVDNNNTTKTVTVQPTLDSYGNQYYAWTVGRTDNGGVNSILVLGQTYYFSFAASYTSPSTGTVNSGVSDIAGPYLLVADTPEPPRNLTVTQTDVVNYGFLYNQVGGVGGPKKGYGNFSTATLNITWDVDTAPYGDPAVQYILSAGYTYRQFSNTLLNSGYDIRTNKTYTVYLNANSNSNTSQWDPYTFYGKQKNDGQTYASYTWSELTPNIPYTFSVTSKDSKGKLSAPVSVTFTPFQGSTQPKTIQSVSVYKCNPTGSYAIPVTLVPNQAGNYVTPTYFTVYWSSTNPPTSIGQQYIADKKYYAGFANQGAVYDNTGQGYIRNSVVYLNGGFPTNTSELYFGVNSVYSYTDSDGNLQYTYNPTIVWTQNVKNL